MEREKTLLPRGSTKCYFLVLISRVATLIPYTKKVLILIRVVWYVSFWYWYDTFPKTILWYLCSFFWYLLQKTELATVTLFFCCYFLCWYDMFSFFSDVQNVLFLVICLFCNWCHFFLLAWKNITTSVRTPQFCLDFQSFFERNKLGLEHVIKIWTKTQKMKKKLWFR